MTDIIDFLRTELSYAHDLDRLEALPVPHYGKVCDWTTYCAKEFGWRIFGAAKGFARGSVYGAALGGLAGLVLGEEVRVAAICGFAVCGVVDLAQFVVRSSPVVMRKHWEYFDQE